MNSTSVQTVSRPRQSRREIVERAERLLNAKVGDSVPIARLCRLVGVSERSLRNAFYAERGVSPKRCALRTRLDEARRALRAADARRGSVTAIATGFGFFELGRFAGMYKAAYGETPSETLRGHVGREAAAAALSH